MHTNPESLKEKGKKSLVWLLEADRPDEVLCCGHLSRVLGALNQQPELAHEWADLLWAFIESFASKLNDDHLMESLWASIAKRLLPKDSIRLCEAVIRACEGHSGKFCSFISHRQPLPEVLEAICELPLGRNRLEEAVKAGKGGPFLRTWMEHAFPQRAAEAPSAPPMARIVTDKKAQEEDLVRRFFQAYGVSVQRLERHESPDFKALINGQTIGIEVTLFHADEQGLAGGSALRREEQSTVRATGLEPYGMWVPVQWEEPFATRVREKISSAQRFDRAGMDGLWLLVVGSAPIWGATVSTAVCSPFVTSEKLQKVSGQLLEQSAFDAAFFYSVIDNTLFKWRKRDRWAC
jgi:hypothetical protein